ncbi:MAG: Tol-Pal system beta propeller repeat protein TolB [Pseudomonadota bacterium]
MRLVTLIAAALMVLAPMASAQTVGENDPGPLRITIEEGIREPMPIAAPNFVALDPLSEELAESLTRVMMSNLGGTGLFREIPQNAHLAVVSSVSAPPNYADWQVINAQALVVGEVSTLEDGRMRVDFRLYDVFGQREIGQGTRLTSDRESWRRIAHKVADTVYGRLTGEGPYFDSRIAFIDETGPKADRTKRLAVMDQDGANVRYLTNGADLVLAPRFSPNGRDILFTSFAGGVPRATIINSETGTRQVLDRLPGMTFAPRFSPDGTRVVYSRTVSGTTNIFEMELATRRTRQLTRGPAIDTAPSYSPDGAEMVFESNRGGSQQIYVMNSDGSNPTRISFGQGRYATPVWSPRGDKIAFTKIVGGRFHIGVMDRDGSNERLLTAAFLDEAPTWSPNGRVLMFFRETPGPRGTAALVSVDVTGLNLKYVRTPGAASDPSWSPVRTD